MTSAKRSGRTAARLERLCEKSVVGAVAAPGRLRLGRGCLGIERLEAQFRGPAYSLHRHDTYAIGITLTGAQTFRYRGSQRLCRPQEIHVLHPDEPHDGGSASPAGFSYRICYLDPAIIQEALGGRPLPFVTDPIVNFAPPVRDLLSRLWDLDDEVDDMGRAEIAVAVADALAAVAAVRAPSSTSLALPALLRVREFLAATPALRPAMPDLERVGQLDRWALARQFRAAFGTSPSRFRTMRQLDCVRALVRSGASLSEAALEAGFADQSHMSRKFKSAYGLTPARWAAALA